MKINLYRRWISVGFSLIILLLMGSSVVGVSADGAGPPLYLPVIGGKLNYGPGMVAGRVINASSGAPVEIARVCINPTKCKTTGSDGKYQLTGVDPGGHLLTATADKFNSNSRWMGVIAGESSLAELCVVTSIYFGKRCLAYRPDLGSNSYLASKWHR